MKMMQHLKRLDLDTLCQGNAQDLRFQSSSGAELKYEIASWNQSGKSIVWLNVPT